MVASRKPPSAAKPRPPRTQARGSARAKGETIDELMARILAEPIGTPLNITKRQAVAILKRMGGSEPNARPGQEIIDEFYGLNPDGSVKRGRANKR